MTVGEESQQRVTAKAVLIWSVALFAYVVAVLQRTSLGVASDQASDRFGISAATLATFSVVQLAVYAGMQLPCGVLLDRFGSRRMIAGGALLMAAGQLLIAHVVSVPWALVARVLIGGGDAMTFVSALRLVAVWFPARRVPLLTQFTGLIGQLGQILSAFPLVWALAVSGWVNAFTGLAAIGLLASVLSILAIRDTPAGSPPPSSQRRERIGVNLRAVLASSGSWLGFWTHFVTQFSLNTFTLMWGFRFLIEGEALPQAQASALLTVNVLSSMVAGPVLGVMTGRHPARRSAIVLSVALALGLAWAMVLIPTTPRPLWQLVIFVVVLAWGGPASMIGFDFARTYNSAQRLGTASGFVNIGGFVAALTSILAIGIVLDVLSPAGATTYSLSAYRLAWSVMAVPWTMGVVGVLVCSRRLRAGARRGLPQ